MPAEQSGLSLTETWLRGQDGAVLDSGPTPNRDFHQPVRAAGGAVWLSPL